MLRDSICFQVDWALHVITQKGQNSEVWILLFARPDILLLGEE